MHTEIYLARQPIVDARHQPYAYELLFRRSSLSLSADVTDPLQAGVDVIHNTLCMGTDWLLQGRLAFINVDEATLMSDYVTLLPPAHVVFEILETVSVSPVLIARIHELRQKGYRFALDDFVCLPEYLPLMPLVDYIKLDVLEQHPAKTREIIALVRGIFKGKILAEKVENREMFELCRTAGVEYFQGYYFAHPENISNTTLAPAQATVLALMNQVRTCEDLSELEEPIRRDPALTLKLLRFVNSASMGLGGRVQNIRHALAIAGLNALYRMLSLLLVTASTDPATHVRARTAAARGRLCELLGSHRGLSRGQQEELFITGLFSLLESMTNCPLAQILDRVPLPESALEALLNRSGPYAPYLELTELSERQDFQAIEVGAVALGFDANTLNGLQLQALSWAEGLDLE